MFCLKAILPFQETSLSFIQLSAAFFLLPPSSAVLKSDRKKRNFCIKRQKRENKNYLKIITIFIYITVYAHEHKVYNNHISFR